MAAVVPFVCRFSWPLVLSRRWRRFASRLVSRLVWAFCVVGRLVSVFILLRRFCQFVFPCCLVCSRRCCCSIRVRPVVRVGWRRVVEALRRGGAWLPWYGRYGCCVAICDAGRRGVASGGSCGAVSCGGTCRERDEGRDAWRDEERDEMDEMIGETHSLVKTRRKARDRGNEMMEKRR